MQLLHKELFQVCSLQTHWSADACRSYQVAYERTTSMTNELTSLTSANQIFLDLFPGASPELGRLWILHVLAVDWPFQQIIQAHEQGTAGDPAAVQTVDP